MHRPRALSGLRCLFLLIVSLQAAWVSAEGPAPYPAPAPPVAPSQLGLGVQRTMTLLATSTPEHRNRVRILFYGQSITEQEWSKRVADDLRHRFPNADLEIENRAIGGFASQLLIRPAEHDLYPFYPDLLIFHVYGGNGEYEQIIKNVRSRTAAEVLMQLDHVAAAGVQETPDQKKDKGLWWDYMMNHQFLPGIARKYGCGLVDVRTPWLDYLKANQYPPQKLLKDGVHLNDQGNYLMAQLVGRYLVYRPELPKTEWKDLAHTMTVGQDVKPANDGKLVAQFDGNRVDLIPARDAKGSAKVLIDGKAPSEFPGCYRITRPQPGPWSPLFLSRVDHDTPLVLEDWTLKVRNVSADGKTWDFDLTGSVTGPDGSGRSDQPFTSQSGRVKIDPAAWFRGSNPPLPNGYTITWKVLPMFDDTFAPPAMPDASLEYAVTVAQGLPNGGHTLEVMPTDGAAVPVRAVRYYTPPIK